MSTSNPLECRMWRIDTCAPGDLDACSPGLLTLARESTATKGKTTVVKAADYLVRFEIDITRP